MCCKIMLGHDRRGDDIPASASTPAGPDLMKQKPKRKLCILVNIDV